jgi:hypothetical protein
VKCKASNVNQSNKQTYGLKMNYQQGCEVGSGTFLSLLRLLLHFFDTLLPLS